MSQEKSTKRTDKSTYEAEYPFNKVFETPGGHQFQFDDTPGKERFFWRHPSGNFMEVSHDGKAHNVNVGDHKSYNKAGTTTTTDENSDSKTSGHSRSLSGGGTHSETGGDTGSFSGGDVATVIMGKNNMRCASQYCGTDGDSNENVGGAKNTKVKGQYAQNAAKISLNGAAGGASDLRLKHDIQDIPNALETVCKMRGVSFKWNDTEWLGHRRRHGVIAQEMELVLPEVVDTDDTDGHKMVYYTELIGHLIESIKTLKAEIDELKKDK